MGLAGGIQVFEPASANVTTVDMIRRFGGSTSQMAQWPEEDAAGDDDEDRYDRIEKLIEKAIKRMSSTGKRKTGAGSATGTGTGTASDGAGSASGGGDDAG